jgi:hypothetical protein
VTDQRFREEGAKGCYYVSLRARGRSEEGDTTAADRQRLWALLEDMTGFTYSLR